MTPAQPLRRLSVVRTSQLLRAASSLHQNLYRDQATPDLVVSRRYDLSNSRCLTFPPPKLINIYTSTCLSFVELDITLDAIHLDIDGQYCIQTCYSR